MVLGVGSCAVSSKDLVPEAVRIAPAQVAQVLRELDGLSGPGDPDALLVRQELRRLVLYAPRDADARAGLGTLALQLGDEAEAARELDAALSIDPGNTAAAVLRARMLLGEGNSQRARRVLDAALLRRPGDPELHLGLAQVEHLEGEPEFAREHLERARRLGANENRVLLATGLVAEAAGENDAARAAYEALLVEDPGNQEAQIRLLGLQP